jgi:hypothetical protein
VQELYHLLQVQQEVELHFELELAQPLCRSGMMLVQEQL